MSQKTFEAICSLLNGKNISYKHEHHETIGRSSDKASEIRGTKLSDGAKALVLKTKSGKFFQAIIPADKKANLKELKKLNGEKNVSLASPNEVLLLTDCVIGSVPPFGIFWNLIVFADKSLLGKKEVVFSAGTLEDSIFISPKDLINCNNASIVNIAKEKE